MSDLTLTDDTPTNYTYKFISSKSGEILLRDSASSLDEPRTFRVSHQVASEPNGTDRHLAQLVRVDDDAEGVPFSGAVHVVLAMPREAVAAADMEIEWQKLKNYIDDNWSDFINGFLPSLT